MAELMANSTVMEKVQSEIRRVLAGQGRVRKVAVRDMGYLKADQRDFTATPSYSTNP